MSDAKEDDAIPPDIQAILDSPEGQLEMLLYGGVLVKTSDGVSVLVSNRPIWSEEVGCIHFEAK